MRLLLGLTIVVSMLLGGFGFIVSGTAGRGTDMLKGLIIGGLPALIGLFALFRVVFAQSFRLTDRIAIAVACVPIAWLAVGILVSNVRRPRSGPAPRMEVRSAPPTAPAGDTPSQPSGTSPAAAPDGEATR